MIMTTHLQYIARTCYLLHYSIIDNCVPGNRAARREMRLLGDSNPPVIQAQAQAQRIVYRRCVRSPSIADPKLE